MHKRASKMFILGTPLPAFVVSRHENQRRVDVEQVIRLENQNRSIRDIAKNVGVSKNQPYIQSKQPRIGKVNHLKSIKLTMHFTCWRPDWRHIAPNISRSSRWLHYRPGRASTRTTSSICWCLWLVHFRQSLIAKDFYSIILNVIILFQFASMCPITFGPLKLGRLCIKRTEIPSRFTPPINAELSLHFHQIVIVVLQRFACWSENKKCVTAQILTYCTHTHTHIYI